MSRTDIYIRELLWNYSIVIIIFGFIVHLILVKNYKALRPFFMNHVKKISREYEKQTEVIKSALFHDLDDVVSGITDLRNKGLIRILEIGVGSGSNLKYYPQQCRLIVADPNPYFKSYFLKQKHKFPDIFLEKYLTIVAENLQGVQSNSVDVVVTCLMLCSVFDVRKVLKEIHRVLVPGGRYYFLEHVGDEINTKNYRVQNIVSSKLGIWPAIFGCYLDRQIDLLIAQTNFTTVAQKRIRIKSKKTSKFFNLIELNPHLVGVAVK